MYEIFGVRLKNRAKNWTLWISNFTSTRGSPQVEAHSYNKNTKAIELQRSEDNTLASSWLLARYPYLF